jgi:TfoX/Sxy family transcriptional regulator of competence genes
VAYSEELAQRIREAIGGRTGVTERKLFGDVVWMVNGNIAVGTLGENLMVRLTHDDVAAALLEPLVGPADPTGRRMHDYLTIDAAAIADDDALAGWVDAGADHAASLPPK